RELWEQTCFECFLASSGRPGYWEFNLSPAGHWNVYRFDSYRAGMQDETAFEALPFSVFSRPGFCEVAATISMLDLGVAERSWQLAIATVVAQVSGGTSYWALAHPGDRPDFHHPESFLVQLAAGES
ncbi:MAG: DOMON-like domain-containing protein, partial [Cyanobacteria bacterium REEB65]|nr:DOMON-like domain-containing protein [Cyanobacteria bacterium REEB65]